MVYFKSDCRRSTELTYDCVLLFAYPANWRSSVKRLIILLMVSSFLLLTLFGGEDTDLQAGKKVP